MTYPQFREFLRAVAKEQVESAKLIWGDGAKAESPNRLDAPPQPQALPGGTMPAFKDL